MWLQGQESSKLQLEFTFDDKLDQMTEEKHASSTEIGDPPQPIPMPNQSASPTFHTTEDLGLKIASVKKVWESNSITPLFEHRFVPLCSHLFLFIKWIVLMQVYYCLLQKLRSFTVQIGILTVSIRIVHSKYAIVLKLFFSVLSQ